MRVDFSLCFLLKVGFLSNMYDFIVGEVIDLDDR